MLTVEYRGYTIHFSENNDQWECWDVKASSQSLSNVKKKIDRLHLQLRKENSVEAITVRNEGKVQEATIVEYDKPIRAKTHSFQRVGDGEIEDHRVFFMGPAGFSRSDRKSRQNGNLSELYEPTPENLAITKMMQEITANIKALENERYDLKQTLKPIPFSALENLVKASNHKFTEGES